MTMSLRHGRRRGWRLALATAAAVAVTVALSPVAWSASATTPTADANPTACANRVNNTPKKLVDCVKQGRPLGLHGQVPADRGRQSGRRRPPVPQFGRARLQGLGRLRGRRHESSGIQRDVAGIQVPLPQLRRGAGVAGGVADAAIVRAREDFNPAQVAGSPSAKLQPAGGIVVPATPTPSSASGCQASDFAGFIPGNIALIQRGTCTFAQRAKR